VPIVARWHAPGSAPSTLSQFTLNIDLAPTIVEAAGVSQHNPFDGRSLLPLLRGDTSGWRSDFLVEHLSTGTNDQASLSAMTARPPTGQRKMPYTTACCSYATRRHQAGNHNSPVG
jgi:hypothetical protein